MQLLIKIKKVIFEKIIGRIFYQRHTDSLRKHNIFFFCITKINQFLNENGCQVPWIMSPGECGFFWSHVDNQSKSDGNRPANYAEKSKSIVSFLNEFWQPHVNSDNSIVELGCNSGANLFYLKELGYSYLGGVEINLHAIATMQEMFPGLKESISVSVGSIKDVLAEKASRSVDVLFTMAVSMHIHPKENLVFKEIARVARQYVCTIEPEFANSNYVFARNYRRVYESLGLVQLKSCLITPLAFPQITKPGMTARLFKIIL